ncbi:MAG: FtsX-like permease family protein [Actinomycetota bacterium]|nr:FtsX-like permease family protein [Actinomycetota bacterium]
MFKTTLKNLLARKLRLFTTGFAVVLGVAFMAGTLVLTDTIGQTFDELFADVNAGTDAHVRGEAAFEDDFGNSQRRRIDAALVDQVAAVDGVATAEGEIEGYTQIVGSDGDAVGDPNQAPTFGRNWTLDETLNPFDIAEGRPPEGEGEVVIDQGVADTGELAVGDRTTVVLEAGSFPVEVVGIATFGEADSPGGSSNVLFASPVAQELIAEPGRLDAVNVVADEGVGEAELRDRIAAEVPDGVEVLTGAEITEEDQDAIGEFVDVIQQFLLAFAIISLLVGVFIIYNTFSIIVAQRTREMALLRAVGASRRQVLGSVVLESLVIGFIASLVGLAAGVGVASGLKSIFSSIGFDLPSSGLVVKSSTVVAAIVVGVVVSLASALFPAIRASRVPPLAAMRDVALEGGRSTVRLVIGGLITVLGAAQLLNGLFGTVENELLVVGTGALALVIGVAVLGPVFAKPLSRLIGSPLPRVKGVAGTLARENAVRNPSRTATTASALMIGVALVGFITIVGSSAKASIDKTIEGALVGDFVVESGQFGLGGLSPEVATRLNELPEVETAAGLRAVPVELDGQGTFVSAVDPRTIGDLLDLGITAGSYEDLDETAIAVHDDTAVEQGLAIGDTVPVVFTETGAQELTVGAIYDNGELFGFENYFVGTAVAEANLADQFDLQVYVNTAQGVGAGEARAAIATVTDDYPTAEVQDQTEFREAQAAPIDQFLSLVYVLLSFSVVIALFGIANTLALSVFERTRELGLLRAVGATRSQVRSVVRWESVIIALLGTLLGLVIGAFFGWALVTAVEDEGFNTLRVPFGQLAVITVVAAFAGVIAAVRPARRAAKLDVLQAIATT